MENINKVLTIVSIVLLITVGVIVVSEMPSDAELYEEASEINAERTNGCAEMGWDNPVEARECLKEVIER